MVWFGCFVGVFADYKLVFHTSVWAWPLKAGNNNNSINRNNIIMGAANCLSGSLSQPISSFSSLLLALLYRPGATAQRT